MKRETLGRLLCGLMGLCLGAAAGAVAATHRAPGETRAVSEATTAHPDPRDAVSREAPAARARRSAPRAPAAAAPTATEETEAETEAVVEVQPLPPEAEARFAEAWQQAVELRAGRRAEAMDFLAAVDPALLSHEEASVHETYLQLLERLQTLRAEVAAMAWEDMPIPLERKVALGEAERALRAAAHAERTLLLKAVARSLELNADEVQQFSEVTEAILNATEAP